MPVFAVRPHSAGGKRSLLRLWPYVRPVRVRLAAATLLAIVASCLGLAMPLVLKWLVDGPVSHRDPSGVWLGGLWLLLLGIAEAGIFGVRRWLAARPLAEVEAAMREDLYRHVQRLPVSVHDRWSAGQLLSRGTTDLQVVRVFLAEPATFLLVNAVTIVAGVVILVIWQWVLALVVLTPVLPLLVLCARFESRYSRASRRAQDQSGDLTTAVAESVLGIRVIKGLGQHRSRTLAFREQARRLHGTELHKAHLLARLSVLITTLPEVAAGATLVLGAAQVAGHRLSAGTLLAFVTLILVLLASAGLQRLRPRANGLVSGLESSCLHNLVPRTALGRADLSRSASGHPRRARSLAKDTRASHPPLGRNGGHRSREPNQPARCRGPAPPAAQCGPADYLSLPVARAAR
jgi:ATP-binding cassette, subfamily B, bacterial